MAIHIYFYQCNADFSQEYADEHYDGKPSKDNIQYHWEDYFVIKGGVFKISEPIHDTYILAGQKDGDSFEYEVPNMLKFKFLGDNNQVTEIAVSESILIEYKKNKKGDETAFHFYLKDDEVFANPIPGVYIDVADFPKELK